MREPASSYGGLSLSQPGAYAGRVSTAAFIAAALLALLYGTVFSRAEPSPVRTAAKTGSVILLAVWAALAGGPLWLIAALGLSAIGDACLAQRDEERWLLPGMGAFFAAHVAYVLLFAGVVSGGFQIHAPAQFALLALGAAFLAFLWPKLEDMRWPVLAYTLVIVAMGCAALLLPPAFAWAKWGALAFIASDMILSQELFVLQKSAPVRRITSPLLWALYWGGQAAIAWAFIGHIGGV